MAIEDFERQSDVIDQAQRLNEAHQERSLALAREKVKPEQVQNEDGTWPEPECRECGDEIPEGRLQLGKVYCVFCQEARERRERGLF